jgi:hypothetical protein
VPSPGLPHGTGSSWIQDVLAPLPVTCPAKSQIIQGKSKKVKGKRGAETALRDWLPLTFAFLLLPFALP